MAASDDLQRYANHDPPDDDAAQAIHDAFLASAQRFAEKQINSNLRHRVSVSEAVNSAMRSALSDVRNQRFETLDSDSFRSRLLSILRNKVVSRIRGAVADMRSPDNETDIDAVLLRDGKELTPVAKAAIDEVAALAAVAVLKSTGDSLPIRACVAALGVLYGCPPTAVQEALRSEFPAEEVPALRTIQRQIQQGRTLLESCLSEMVAEDDDRG